MKGFYTVSDGVITLDVAPLFKLLPYQQKERLTVEERVKAKSLAVDIMISICIYKMHTDDYKPSDIKEIRDQIFNAKDFSFSCELMHTLHAVERMYAESCLFSYLHNSLPRLEKF